MSKIHSIEELKQKCAEKNMPLEKMRFFIGEDRKEPKCFGVYQDEETGNWIVYKNKANGSRAVRYNGPDEARAAQEIWDKIGEEVKIRKDRYASPYDEPVRSYPDKVELTFWDELKMNLADQLEVLWNFKWLTIPLVIVIIYTIFQFTHPAPKNGYYQVNDNTYYHLGNKWYQYDNGGWIVSYIDEDDIDDYYIGDSFADSYGTSDFKDTDYYEDYLEDERYDNEYTDDDNDADHDYDYDTWDAGDTDWNSDW